MSQRFFSERFAAEKMVDCQYDNYPLLDIEEFPRLLANNPYLMGLNVTMPYKGAILEYCDLFDNKVLELGAANVLTITRDNLGRGVVKAYNTDIIGIEKSLLPYFDRVKRALIFGTGGAAKSVKYVLDKYEIESVYVSRTLKGETNVISYGEVARQLSVSQLVVNASPIGMYPNSDEVPPIDYSFVEQNHILFDVVYNPIETKFLKIGKKKGCTLVSGIKMFEEQARATFDIFFEKK